MAAIVSLDKVDDLSARCWRPRPTKSGTLTEPREFNLMFKTIVGAMGGEEDAAFLRPETAQGIFVNFKNVIDSTRVRVPFGIAQVGKSFRNEITPRNFTFRSREFEQMEIEFFCHPRTRGSGTSTGATGGWRGTPIWAWPASGCGCASMRTDELSHYSAGTADIEYAFPFLAAGEFGELEGIAHRGDFDLRSHMEGKLVQKACPLTVEMGEDGKPQHKGSGRDLTYRDDVTNERFTPHVIEPSAGADRATLAFLCEAYHEDQAPDDKGDMQTRDGDEVSSADCAGQGGRVSAGEEGRHAGGGAGDLHGAEEAVRRRSTTRRARSAAAIAGRTKRARRFASRSTARRCRTAR